MTAKRSAERAESAATGVAGRVRQYFDALEERFSDPGVSGRPQFREFANRFEPFYHAFSDIDAAYQELLRRKFPFLLDREWLRTASPEAWKNQTASIDRKALYARTWKFVTALSEDGPLENAPGLSRTLERHRGSETVLARSISEHLAKFLGALDKHYAEGSETRNVQ